MKTMNKNFKTVDFMRKIRNKISKDIQDFDYAQIKEYFAQRRQNTRLIPKRKNKTHS